MKARSALRRLRTAGAGEPPEGQGQGPSSFSRELPPGRLAQEQDTVTRTLYERLSPEDLAAVEALIRDTPGAWSHYFGEATRAENHDLLLALGVWLGSERLIERTGLVRAEPPEDVHTMTRGAQNAAGGLYEANLVIDALHSGGGDIGRVSRALDFGCSSGRVLRPLAAAFPQIEWSGCDPNGPAIAWASENVPGIAFFTSGPRPPLPVGDGELDLAYAISIWSHFNPPRGLEWFTEMHRLIAPGGYLVMTTHGPTSVAHYVSAGLRSAEQARAILDALYKRGWWYAAEFGAAGDWGVVDPDWGTAFVSPEWLLAQLCPSWGVVEYAAGRNQENQDVYVLQRL